jgi:hypothetical protein
MKENKEFEKANPDLSDLRAKVKEVMQQHTREVYMERLRRCGVILK